MGDQKFFLNNGLEIPAIGYGSPIVLTYKYQSSVSQQDIVKYWLKNKIRNKRQYKFDSTIKSVLNNLSPTGFQLLDTSRAYGGSEQCIGNLLNKSKRSDYFITTKLSNKDQRSGNIRSAFETSLSELQTDYIDLYLMHWPVTETYLEAWKEIEILYKEKLCRAIGVCNFNIHHLEAINAVAEVQPMVNQIECHPLFTQNELRNYCNNNNIRIMAYTSTARMDERLLKTCLPDIAKKYKKTVTQIILRWQIQLGNIPIVNTTNNSHLAQNYAIFDFELTDDEIELITAININSRLRYDPDNCDFDKL